MKKELTVGDVLTILVIIIGWAVSVEVRIATANTKSEALYSTVQEMSKQVKEIHEEVIRHDERINKDLPQVVTRGGIIKPKNK